MDHALEERQRSWKEVLGFRGSESTQADIRGYDKVRPKAGKHKGIGEEEGTQQTQGLNCDTECQLKQVCSTKITNICWQVTVAIFMDQKRD